MKKLKALYVGMAMTAAAASLTSCQADMDAPALVEPKATMEANTTISDFKTAFADQTVLCPMKDEESQTPYIIKGRVISSDATGNIYKSIVIQDETAALAISINQGSTYTDYRLGQEIVLNATGLYIGYYNGLQQIGWYDLYNDEPSLTFLAWDYFLAHSELNGFPNPDVKYVAQDETWPAENPYCIVTTFSQLPATGEAFRNMQSQLVEFRNVHFEEGGKETYAPYQESVNRTLVDASGSTLIVRTSGYSNFYNEMIPEGTGTVRGILSYYGDAWQLLLRSLDDVIITEKGQKDDPYTIEEAIAAQNEGFAGWVEAYIVGSVKAGVNDVTSNDDVIFGADAEMDNNILIAASADETDWTKCLAVELPQGSAFRAAVNLVDNPQAYKKAILVNGTLSTFLGMPGLTGNGGTASDVEVDGITIGSGTTPEPVEGLPNGDGSESTPFSASQVNAMSTTNSVNLYTDVWVTGYIVGYVDTGIKSYAADESAKFTVPATVATNLLLANSPDEKDWNKCISVNLPSKSDSRTQLNLMDNPENLGKLLNIKGNVTRYVGLSGVKEPSEFNLGEGGGDTPERPVTSGSIYESLISNADGWTFDDITVPSAVTKGIWQWDDQYGVLKASAYVGGSNYEALSYAVSPEIDLSGYTFVSATFDQAAKFQTTLTKLCGFAVREVGATVWTELTVPSWPAAGVWTATSAGDIDLSVYAGKKIQVAFKYGSSSSGADTWQIKNLKITGSK
ncbi:MAG: hypothetical protein HDR94_01565 [Bacteroides sp.]|nr:hypothetical protein [Bacteroides sp.]